MKVRQLIAVVIALGACASEPDETLGEEVSDLYTQSGVTLYRPGEAIRVCWVTVTLPGETLPASGLYSAKLAFRDELRNAWERWANTSFVGFQECPTSGSDRYIRVQIRWEGFNPDGTPAAAGGACVMGTGAYQLPGPVSTTSDNSGLSCGVGVDRRWNDGTIDAGTRAWIRTRWKYVAVHEMGHVLGFAHEQDRTDNPGGCTGASIGGTNWTAYDRFSVMNYCGPNNGELTPDDIRGAIAAYGRRTWPGPAMFYNGFEGNDASAWWFAGHAGVDRGIGQSRTGANNGWAAQWTADWNADNVYVSSGGAGHRCDVEVQSRMFGGAASTNFWILDNPGTTGWFYWPNGEQNIYSPVKFSFDATADTHILVAGFWGNGSSVHYQQIDDATVNCSTNLSAINFDSYWQTGTSVLVSADHLAGTWAAVRYQNVPVSGGGYAEQWGNTLTPDASHRLVLVRDMGLSGSGLWCSAEQLAGEITASIMDSTGTDSKAVTFPARWLCFNG